MQVDNQLPFCVYPQLLYPLPPPPTVATSTGECCLQHLTSNRCHLKCDYHVSEPKPLFEASVILNRGDQDNAQSTNTVKHLKYVHTVHVHVHVCGIIVLLVVVSASCVCGGGGCTPHYSLMTFKKKVVNFCVVIKRLLNTEEACTCRCDEAVYVTSKVITIHVYCSIL